MSEQNGNAAGSGMGRVDPSLDTLAAAAASAGDSADFLQQAQEAGAMLRRIRESAGVDLMLLATTLKVTPQKIMALEEGRFGDLPDMTFARGLAAAVCRAFGVDPDPVLTLMPVVARGLQMKMQPVDTTGASEPPPRQPPPPVTFSPGGSDGNSLLRWFSEIPLWLAIVVVVLLVGALVVWFLPDWRLRPNNLPEVSASVAVPASGAASAASEAASDVASAVVFGADSAADAASAPASSLGAGGAPGQAASTTAAATVSTTAASTTAATATVTPNTPAEPTITLNAKPAPVVPASTTASAGASKPGASVVPAPPQAPVVTAAEAQVTAAALRAEAASAERAAVAASRAEAASAERSAATASRAAAAAASRAAAASAAHAERALAASRASAALAALAAQRGSSGAAASAQQTAGSASGAAQRGSGVTEANVVTFSASGPVWVSVNDGEGKTVFAHVLNGGETTSVGGLLPLTVTVGDRSAVSVKVRGGPVDLDRYSRSGGTVAKFTVEPRRSAQ